MNTKTFITALLLLFVLSSCEKDDPISVDSQTPKEVLLTSSQWIFNEYFTNYSQPAARVAYKAGKPDNILDLSLAKMAFHADNSFFTINEKGDTARGTWRLIENENHVELKYAAATNTLRLVGLTSTGLVWHDESRNVYARMLPVGYTPSVNINIGQLTGKSWVYTEYYTSFSLPQTGLAFKADKSNNLMDLSKNRVIFNEDGSVSEINEAGDHVPGTWRRITIGGIAGLEVKNYSGVHQSLIIQLSDSSFVWYSPDANRYAKMKVAPEPTSTPTSARAKILCSGTWLYTEYFSNYSEPAAYLSYKREKATNNPVNLSTNRVTFSLNGTYTEITETGTTLQGTWQLLEQETKLKTTNGQGQNTSSIVQLDSLQFIWHDAVNDTYGKMAPVAKQPVNRIDVQQLTGKTWVYHEYFTSYSSLLARLVFKKERSTNDLNLVPNTVVFNANGTFNEIDQNGWPVSGIWHISTDNELITENSMGGRYKAKIIRLDEKSFWWYDEAMQTYGKMTLKN